MEHNKNPQMSAICPPAVHASVPTLSFSLRPVLRGISDATQRGTKGEALTKAISDLEKQYMSPADPKVRWGRGAGQAPARLLRE